jgi:Family of unknown function (DUF5677)
MGKKQKKRRREQPRDPRQIKMTPPKQRMKPIFQIFDEISMHCNGALLGVEDAADPGFRFDAAVLMRGINTLRSIRVLLENSFWELASAGARQLFELLVNMEYLASQSDREAASLRYAKFGLMQAASQQLGQLEYTERTGRGVNLKRKEQIEEMLDLSFPDLKSSSGGWVPSWSGKNVRQLAEASPFHLRDDQYQLLFSAWSEQAHATPGALLDGIFLRVGVEAKNQIATDEDREVIEVAGISITIFLQLWWVLPDVPALDKSLAAGWLKDFSQEARRHGAPLPLLADR